MKAIRTACWALPCLAFAATSWGKVGISSNLGDLIVENAHVGRTYNLREVKGVAMKIQNTGDAPMAVVTEVKVPSPKLLKDGYEPIPDPSWIAVLPERYELAPGGVAFVDILIKIPNDPALVGHHFQFSIWSHQATSHMLAVGVETRVRFSMGKGPATLAKEKNDKKMLTFNFDLWPQTLYVVKAESGKRYDVKKKEGKSLRIINKAEEPVSLVLKSSPWPSAFPLPDGYEKPEKTEWLKLRKPEIKVKELSIIDVAFELDLPPGHEGKKYVFWIEPALSDGLTFVSGAKVLVTVPGPGVSGKE